jgi:hypothetical protein
MAVRLSVSPTTFFNHLADYIETCIYIIPLEITPPLYSLNFLPSKILACLLCHVLGESDISGTRSAVFKCCMICLAKIMCFFQVIVIDYTKQNMATTQNLQAGRSLVRFPMVSFEFFIDTNLSAALWPWGGLSLWQKWVPGIYPVE